MDPPTDRESEIEITDVLVAGAEPSISSERRVSWNNNVEIVPFDIDEIVNVAKNRAEQGIVKHNEHKRVKKTAMNAMKSKFCKKGKKSKRGKKTVGKTKKEKGTKVGEHQKDQGKVKSKILKEDGHTKTGEKAKNTKTQHRKGKIDKTAELNFPDVQEILIHWQSGEAVRLPDPEGVSMRTWCERKKERMQIRDINAETPSILTFTTDNFGDHGKCSYIASQLVEMYLNGFSKQQLRKIKGVLRQNQSEE